MGAIRLADSQFNLVVDSLAPCVVHPEPCCIKYVLPVTIDFEIQLLESTDSAVACPPYPALKGGFRLFGIIGHGTPLFARMRFCEFNSLIISFTPYFTAHPVKGLHCPFDDMERVNVVLAVRCEFIHAFRDPFCAISGNYPDG